MPLPNTQEARALLAQYVSDPYQRLHADMVAVAVQGYAEQYTGDPHLWWVTGYLHDLDFEQHSENHPGPSLEWFKAWNYPQELIHAVEAHALGFNGFTTQPQTDLARVLLACDEISGIFYAYQKLNPIPYGEMKVSSIVKRVKDKGFAPSIDRNHIVTALERLEIDLPEHVDKLLQSFAGLD